MATILDLGALQYFSGVFPFLLILVIVYAVLTNIPMFKDRHGMAAIISLVLALITLTSRIAVKTINMMSPWFVLFLLFGIILLIVFMSFGVEESTIKTLITGEKWGSTFFMWVLVLVLIITVGSAITVINEEKAFGSLREGGNVTISAGTGVAGTGESAFWSTLFHPKILGMVVILLIGYFTISKLSTKVS